MAELLAPAGEPDSGYAALAYGADAVYCGLDRFSARAEAVNFTPADLADFVTYAHSLTPRRSVYCTLNTLVRQAEFSDAIRTLMDAAECGVDAVIVQDAGIASLVRQYIPSLKLHASTQMAIHNVQGALAAKELGFRRVTLARELTLPEVGEIVQAVGPDMEVETFIHGTLCYSYSGLCLFSSIANGRSGNRGRCVYSCREAAECDGKLVHPFSLKDMALGPRVLDLVNAGVSSLKIEGRKKSPLYVAATVDYYRKILDGNLADGEAADYEARLKTIFARPWTKLFIDSRRNPDAADPQVVGHRGSEIGTIDALVATPAGKGIRFVSTMPVERHDGLQVDVPNTPRPFGFPVNNLYTVVGNKFTSTFAAPAGTQLAVTLPEDAPVLSSGLPLYLSSSQAVKRSYPFSKPKPGAHAPRLPAAVSVAITPGGAEDANQVKVVCRAVADMPHLWSDDASGPYKITAEVEELLPAFPARDTEGAEAAARQSFSRLGEYQFSLAAFTFSNPDGMFIKQGDWNRLRRVLFNQLTKVFDDYRQHSRTALIALVEKQPEPAPAEHIAPSWSIAVDRIGDLAAVAEKDCAEITEFTLSTIHNGRLLDTDILEQLAGQVGRGKIRLALPLIMRNDEARSLQNHVELLYTMGFCKWLLPGWAGWHWFQGKKNADLSADWSMYVFNRPAAREMLARGFSSFTLSPEDDKANMAELFSAYAENAWTLVYADLPLFIAAACAHAHIGLCGKTNSGKKKSESPCSAGNGPLTLRMERSGEVDIYPQGCGSVVTGRRPFVLAGAMPSLISLGARQFRVDCRWKPRTPEEVQRIWHQARTGTVSGGTVGNFERGIV